MRQRVWVGSSGTIPFSGAPATPDCFMAPLYVTGQMQDEDKTLVRLRGFWTAQIVSPGASSAPVFVWAGIGVQNRQAVTALALPCPFTEVDWGGWLWQGQLILSTANPAIRDATNSPMCVVDGKGKRKVQEDDELFFAVEMLGRASDVGINVCFSLRGLLLLH